MRRFAGARRRPSEDQVADALREARLAEERHRTATNVSLAMQARLGREMEEAVGTFGGTLPDFLRINRTILDESEEQIDVDYDLSWRTPGMRYHKEF